MPQWVALGEAFDCNRFGGKAAYLARAARGGLPVPSGLVIPVDWQPQDTELIAAANSLGADKLAVRSSSTVEEQPHATAAGIFVSCLDVSPQDVPQAVRAVRASVDAAPAKAYLTRQGVSDPVGMAVIIQAMVPRKRYGFAASGDPIHVEAYDEGSRDPKPWTIDASLVQGAEAVLESPIAIEWAEDIAGKYWLLQLRPHYPQPYPEFPIVWSRPEDAQVLWRWDCEHNPEAVSFAQEGLINWLGGTTRVFSGYVYEAVEAPRPGEDALEPWFEETIGPLENLGKDDCELAPALTWFKEFVARYAAARRRAAEGSTMPGIQTTWVAERDHDLVRLGRLARSVPGLLDHLRDPSSPVPPSLEMADWFAALRSHLDRFGACAPAWDMAAPTFGENPRPLYPAILAFASQTQTQTQPKSSTLAGDLAQKQNDDLLYVRALRVVRRAVLALGRRLVRKGDLKNLEDVFFLPWPLDKLPGHASDLVLAGKAEHIRRQALVPPLTVQGSKQQFSLSSDAVFFGLGMGGRARGKARVVTSLTRALEIDVRGCVLVVPTVLPQIAFLLGQAVALVADHGGRLDHGAVLACEYSLPAVVGVRNATRQLHDGEEVLVDGTTGKVYRL